MSEQTNRQTNSRIFFFARRELLCHPVLNDDDDVVVIDGYDIYKKRCE